jgi:transglutaminase-like putative cysteine protease
MRPGPTVALIAAVAAAAGLVVAQTTPQAKSRQTLHEELPPLAKSDAAQPTITRKDGDGNPTAMVVGDKIVPKPQLGTKARPDEPVLGKGGFAADRQTEWKPDNKTGPDSTLNYVSVFNPDVIPFKRMTVFDAINDDYTLRVSRTTLTDLPVGGTHNATTHDRFYGDVRLQLRPGVDVPLPSVAPDMRILSYETYPPIKLKFSKDGADNFFVRSDEASASGQYQLTFWCDADLRYFAPSLPTTKYTLDALVKTTPDEYRVPVPDRVRIEAEKTLAKPTFALASARAGVDRKIDLGVAFDRLVSYFRAFQAGDIKNPTGDIYRDLCDSQAGVCRHRAFAFMVTATALGIPTRYVQNEAHAFVEVWFPQRGWQRIDLGGAALRMNVTGADDKRMHRPRADDPFAKPPEYKDQYTQLEGDIRGLTDDQKSERKKPADQAPTSGQIAAGPGKQNGTGGGSGTGSGTGSNALADNSPIGPDRISPDPTKQVKPQDPTKPVPSLGVTTADTSVFRGDALRVQGTATFGGKPIPNHRVDIFLSPAGAGGEGSIPVGYGVTGADGTFKVEVNVPPTVDLARYEIRLSSADDATYNAALSD